MMLKKTLLYLVTALVLVLTAAVIVRAEETKPAAPKISAELRAKFWRANAEAIAAQVQAQRTDERFRAVQAEMQKACGELMLVSDATGEPTCVEKPKPEAAKK